MYSLKYLGSARSMMGPDPTAPSLYVAPLLVKVWIAMVELRRRSVHGVNMGLRAALRSPLNNMAAAGKSS